MNLCPDFGVRWLFLDLNSYFASCEQQEFPDLRNEPVIVVPFDSNATCAIAASYEAKRLGIKTGTNVGDARSICPKLRVIPARHDVYRHYHEKVIEEVIKHTPIRKVWSIDELESPLSENHRTKEAAEGLALRIKEGLRRNVGECIRASIGLAPNSFLGKVATDMQKPNGLVTLEGHNMLDRLSTLSLRDLPGIGKNFGMLLNYTQVKSKITYLVSPTTTTTIVDDLLNMSPKSWNATLYYDDGKFSGRVSASKRSTFLTRVPGQNNNDVEGKNATLNVDASISYKVNDRLTVTLEGVNLTNEANDQFISRARNSSVVYHVTGREYLLGASYKF